MDNSILQNSEKKRVLQEEIKLDKSYLNNLHSAPLTDGYEVTHTSEYLNALTFFEDSLDATEDELDEFDDDKFLDEFFNS